MSTPCLVLGENCTDLKPVCGLTQTIKDIIAQILLWRKGNRCGNEIDVQRRVMSITSCAESIHSGTGFTIG